MHEVKQRPACHRAEDLVTYLYGEASEADALDFGNHLQQCDACRSEFAVFNQVHDSILTWRNEALGVAFDPRAIAIDSAVESSQFVRHERKLSALAALREFFTVSPLWLRSATAFATLLLFVLGAMMIVRFTQKPAEISKTGKAEEMYTRQQVQVEVNRAIEKTKADLAQQNAPAPIIATGQKHAPNRPQLAANQQSRPGRSRGLSRQEREQLAADLRLTNPADEEELQLALPEQDQQRPNQ
jgi:anti-sigma factor RsiW